MTPKARERAYEKRRYEKWQAKQLERITRRRRIRRILLMYVAPAVAVLVVVGGVVWFIRGSGSPGRTATPAVTPSATASAANPCPAPTVKPPARAKSFALPAKSLAAGRTWKLTMTTSCGTIGLTLDGAKAPQAVSAMLLLGRSGFFDGSPCHRLTTSGIYVLQCGDPTGSGTGGPGFEYGPVENAPKDNVYRAGTVAMARQSGNGKSMGSQFFLVYKDSTIPADSAGGYTVLGTISTGLDVVTKVSAGGVTGGSGDGAPARAISILRTAVTPG